MSVKIRLARYGAKKKPYYHIVASASSSRRDGRFLETLGKYDPLKDTMAEKIISLDEEGIKKRLSTGAQLTAIVTKILAFKGLIEAPQRVESTKKHLPKAKAQERLKQAEEARLAAEAATGQEAAASESSQSAE